LPRNHRVKAEILNSLRESIQTLQKLNEVESSLRALGELDVVKEVNVKEIRLGKAL